MMERFQADAIRVQLGSAVILPKLSFEAQAGQLTVIIGPNGSGKSTLLRALSGELPYKGHIVLNGLDIQKTHPATLAKIRGVLPQSESLAFSFSVLELVQMGVDSGVYAAAYGGPADLAEQALARVHMLDKAKRAYPVLSGGEKQRVQLARVLAQVWEPVRKAEASWLLLDEPVSALDLGHQVAVMRIARDYADAGGGVIAVMHDLNLTAMFSDKVVLMKDGGVLAEGSVPEVLTDANLSEAYDCEVHVNTAPAAGVSFVLPQMLGDGR